MPMVRICTVLDGSSSAETDQYSPSAILTGYPLYWLSGLASDCFDGLLKESHRSEDVAGKKRPKP